MTEKPDSKWPPLATASILGQVPSVMGDGVEVQIGSPDLANLPTEADFRRWSDTALAETQTENAELLIRLVDEEEISALNRRFRHRDHPTNVLSFAYEQLPGVETPFLGDIVICAPVVAREARDQGKETAAHWAHMVTHGILHLCGYDHLNDTDAEEMEQLERKILSTMGYGDPYAAG